VIIRPDGIDDRTVPLPAPHVAIVEVDDGGLLVDEEAGRGYPVNATASLLWKLLDSVSPIGQLIDLDECGEPVRPGAADGRSFDARYLAAPPNA
jgi:hypothetical protein